MTYNPNIPAAIDFISDSQSEIQTNFSLIDSATQGFGLDHFQFSAASNQGKHKQTTFVQLGADPTTAVDEIALYAKDLGGAATLYLKKENGGSVIQMSGRDPSVGASGETFLPTISTANGLLIKWGQIAAAANGVVQNFPSAFPNSCFSVVVTINTNTTVVPVGVNGFTASGFTFRTTGAAVPITYIAIGN